MLAGKCKDNLGCIVPAQMQTLTIGQNDIIAADRPDFPDGNDTALVAF